MRQKPFYFPVKSSLLRLFIILSLFFGPAAISSVQADGLSAQGDSAPMAGSISGCPMFPDNNIWNTPVNTLPVHARSDQWVNSIGRNTGFHMDFGSGNWDGGPIGIPYNVVAAGVTKVPVSFEYPDESDPGPYPIPANPKIEHGSDHHILIVDSSTCTLYELFDASYSGGSWHAGSGAIWNLHSNLLRPDTWTSADAAGLPILPGLVRYDEILSGEIDHAIRFTASTTNGYIWPARHLTSDNPSAPHIPPMGARFRLKASFNISSYPAHMQVILTAMQTYGIILADNGSNWYVSGAPDNRWDNDMLHLLDDLIGNDFEAVNTAVLMKDPDSGATGSSISGNTGVAGVTLSYTDGSPKTVMSAADGSYSFSISHNWSGTVTPSHACFTFTPSSRSYSSVTTNQTAQNYNATFDASSGCADIDVLVGGVNRGNYGLLPGASARASFPGVNSGPVWIRGINGVPLIGAERVIYRVNGVNTSFSEMMGLPHDLPYTTFWLPWYNNVDLDTQLRIANVTGSPASVQVFIGGTPMTGTPFDLAAGASTRVSFPGVNAGPVQIVSTQAIVAAERVIYRVNGLNTSFTEMMALPASQLDTTYWLPWYNNKELDTQLRIANVSGFPASVHVYISGAEMQGSPFSLLAGESIRRSFPGISAGPVQIVSDQAIVAAERVIFKVNNVNTSFSEMIALPASQLDATYWLPWYNNVDLDTQLRFANTTNTPASVRIYIGGQEMQGSPFPLPAGESTRKSFPGISGGPVQIVSDVPIVAAERVIFKVNNVNTSFTEMMALPDLWLSTSYYLPWYNNVELDTQLRFGVR
jgi:hypothetical protein